MEGFFNKLELPMASLANVGSINAKCGLCGLYKTCRTPKMQPSGKGKLKVLIVAEAPGKDEDKRGIQLVGKAGQKLMKVLRKLDIDMRNDCWLTNSLICRPPNNIIKDKKAIDYCRPNLIKTIKELDPNVIILLGFSPVRSLIPYAWNNNNIGKTLDRWTGWRIPSQKINAWICPTYHPSYLLRMRGDQVLERMFEEHLRKAMQLSDEKPYDLIPDYRTLVTVIESPEEAARRLAKLLKRPGLYAFDYETNMLKPDSSQARIHTCSISNGKRTLAFPWHGEVIKLMKCFLQLPTHKKVGANIKFETRWTKKILGCDIIGWDYDTMNGMHALDNRTGITGLDFQSFVLLGQPEYKTGMQKYLHSDGGGNTPNKIDQAPLHQLLEYNGLDSLLEYKLATIQKKLYKE